MAFRIKEHLMRLLDRLEAPFLNGFESFLTLSNPRYREKLLFVAECRLLPRLMLSKRITINFIITSKAEIRVYTPIIRRLLNSRGIKANLYFLRPFQFPDTIVQEIWRSTNVRTPSTVYPIIKSCLKPRHWVNVICLDHVYHERHHSVGINAVREINRKRGKTVCLQHGSTRVDNINGHLSSESLYQILWGALIHRAVVQSSKWSKRTAFVTGNPLHDKLLELDSSTVSNNLEILARSEGHDIRNRKIVLVATCLHTEYDHKAHPMELYKAYIRAIYDSINFDKMFLIVKMHPVDSTKPNLYKSYLGPDRTSDLLIIPPDENKFSFYELACVADLVVTRGSTTAEEAILMRKPVIAFDLLEDGPAQQLKLLSSAPGFRKVLGKRELLPAAIDKLISFQPVSNGSYSRFVNEVTYKFDGQSTKRVIDRLSQIARTKVKIS